MKRIDIDNGNGIGRRTYTHRDVCITQHGIEYVVWFDYVQELWIRTRHATLAKARDAVNAMVQS